MSFFMSNSREVYKKAFRIYKSGGVKVDFENEKRIYFIVRGETENHSVIYDKINGKFICDCKWFSIKNEECSHIVAVKLFLKERSDVKQNSPNNKPD